MGIIGILGSLGMVGGGHNGHNRLIRHNKGIGLLGFLVLGVGWLYLCIRKLMRALPCLVSRL